MMKQPAYHRPHPLWLIGCGLLLLTSSGCFMQAGSEPILTPVSQNLPTHTVTPSETPTDTVEPPTATPSVTLDPLVLTAMAEASNAAPTATLTETITPTPGITQVAQVEPLPTDPDERIQGATDFVATITQEALDLTATFEQTFIVPTETLTPEILETFTPTPQPIVPGNDCIHQVSAGENLFRISLRYGVAIRDIAARSNPVVTDINMIYVGQKLTIPGCGTTGAVPPPTSIPTTTGTTGGDVSANPPPSAGGVRHIVDQGETLFQISLQYGVPVRVIAEYNNISNINLIYINQELTIP